MIPLLAAVLTLTLSSPGAGQTASGFYIRVDDLGLSLATSLESTRRNVGIPTNCDQWLPAATLNDGTTVPLPLDQFAPRPLPASPNSFELAASWLVGSPATRRSNCGSR